MFESKRGRGAKKIPNIKGRWLESGPCELIVSDTMTGSLWDVTSMIDVVAMAFF